jgi:hypothetical protein
MHKKCILIGVTVFLGLSASLSNQASATIVRNGTGFPINVTIHLSTKGMKNEILQPDTSIRVVGDIVKLDVFPKAQPSIKPVVCDGVFSESAIEISLKEGSDNVIVCK